MDNGTWMVLDLSIYKLILHVQVRHANAHCYINAWLWRLPNLGLDYGSTKDWHAAYRIGALTEAEEFLCGVKYTS